MEKLIHNRSAFKTFSNFGDIPKKIANDTDRIKYFKIFLQKFLKEIRSPINRLKYPKWRYETKEKIDITKKRYIQKLIQPPCKPLSIWDIKSIIWLIIFRE